MSLPELQWRDLAGVQRRCTVHDRIFIGRVCPGAPDDKRILLNSSDVSRDHAVVTFEHGRLSLRDTSRNGTRVNGVRISPGIDQPLFDQDSITIAGLVIHVNAPELKSESTDNIMTQTNVVSVNQILTHLVADVRGFSTLTQQQPSSVLQSLMQEIFREFSAIVQAQHGVIKDYAGDAIFAFWEHGAAEHSEMAYHACVAASLQERAVQRLLSEGKLASNVGAGLRVGWGLATGTVMLSHYGMRAENLAVVGDSTNLAFRLAALANKELDSSIVLCACTARLVGPYLGVRSLGAVATKGREGLEDVFGLVHGDA